MAQEIFEDPSLDEDIVPGAVHEPVHQDIRYDGGHGTHTPHHHTARHGEGEHEQDPRLFGPGFPTVGHAAEETLRNELEQATKYILVTPDMLEMMNAGRPATSLPFVPGGTATVVPTQTNSPMSPIDEKFGGTNGAVHLEHAPDSASFKDNASIMSVSSHANPIARTRWRYREYLGEFIGTMILIIFGNGVNCQAVLSDFKQGQYLSISFGWGIGVMFGVHAAGGISGGHINPAVTISLATFRGFPWRKVPGYCLAQTLGALIGSILVQANYFNLLNKFEGGYALRTYGTSTSTATLFFTDAQPYMSNISAWCSELFATAVLMGLILSLSDSHNNPAPTGMNGMILLWLIVGIGAALGTETAYCLNPARDLGPRIACAIFGYGSEIWTYRNCYFIYTPIIATICGGLLGSFFYDLFIFQGRESPLNKEWGGRKQKDEMIEKA